MLDVTSVVVLTTAITEALKRWTVFSWVDTRTAPITTAVIAGLLNMLNATSFNAPALLAAFKEGVVIGLGTTGGYAAAKAVLRPSVQPPA